MRWKTAPLHNLEHPSYHPLISRELGDAGVQLSYNPARPNYLRVVTRAPVATIAAHEDVTILSTHEVIVDALNNPVIFLMGSATIVTKISSGVLYYALLEE